MASRKTTIRFVIYPRLVYIKEETKRVKELKYLP